MKKEECKIAPNDKLIEAAKNGNPHAIEESLERFVLALTALAKPQLITKVQDGIELVHSGVDVVRQIRDRKKREDAKKKKVS